MLPATAATNGSGRPSKPSVSKYSIASLMALSAYDVTSPHCAGQRQVVQQIADCRNLIAVTGLDQASAAEPAELEWQQGHATHRIDLQPMTFD